MLKQSDLYSLDQYLSMRSGYRAKVMERKQVRRIQLGEHAALYFEDALTIQYQVQEMLRLEHMVEPEMIQAELDVYNPLIPDGNNWKATFMVEYPDVEERRVALERLIGIERSVWVRVAGFDKVNPIANEDLDRETEEKTSAVHFLRFELTPAMITALKAGAALTAGSDHANYATTVEVSNEVRASLVSDLA